MKKIILAALAAATLGLAAVSVAPTFAKAAPGAAHAGKGGGRLKKMAQNLGLTDAQKAQIKPILKASHEQAKAIKANTALTPESQKAQVKSLHKNSKQQIMAILTPEQREKMKANRAGRHQARRGKA